MIGIGLLEIIIVTGIGLVGLAALGVLFFVVLGAVRSGNRDS